MGVSSLMLLPIIEAWCIEYTLLFAESSRGAPTSPATSC